MKSRIRAYRSYRSYRSYWLPTMRSINFCSSSPDFGSRRRELAP